MVYDPTAPSFVIPNDNTINISIPLTDATPTINLAGDDKINLSIPLSDQTPAINQVVLLNPYIASITDIKIPAGTVTPPTPGSQTNFAIGWWLYVNDQPFVPNNTNFGPGWFMYTNSR